ncbi:DnaT-like ssDNA-binding protein [Enterobacter hormaechei]
MLLRADTPFLPKMASASQMLMQSMDFLEGRSWRGQRSSASQPDPWPALRRTLRWRGHLLDDAIPQRLIYAQCRLAIEKPGDRSHAVGLRLAVRS